MTTMINFDHATKHYPKFTLDMTMSVQPNTITALVGANGSGKTTAFRLALGLARCDSGSVTVLDAPACNVPVPVQQRIAAVFTDSDFGAQSKVDDLIAQLSAFYPRFDTTRCHTLLEQFAVPVRQPIQALSTGMRAKCEVILAICREPDLLVLDEPTAGLDVLARDEILDLLRAYMETLGRSILISSHIARDIETLCDDFYYIHNGHIQLHDTIERLHDEYGVLLLSHQQAEQVDDAYIIARQQMPGGWRMLTDQRAFYQENMPDIDIERGNIDSLITVMEKGNHQ